MHTRKQWSVNNAEEQLISVIIVQVFPKKRVVRCSKLFKSLNIFVCRMGSSVMYNFILYIGRTNGFVGTLICLLHSLLVSFICTRIFWRTSIRIIALTSQTHKLYCKYDNILRKQIKATVVVLSALKLPEIMKLRGRDSLVTMKFRY